MEKVLVLLPDEEYDRIDTTKVPEIMKPTLVVIQNHYGGFAKRSEHLLKTINTDGPVADIAPPNWALHGVGGISKGTLLETLRIQHAPKLTKEQADAIEGMANMFLEMD